jgi:4-hydroxyphenylpyruvate dioxygenase and related hemolysins
MKVAFHHVCIETDRYEESLRFYAGALGFAIEEETAGFHGRAYNTWLRSGDVRIELQTPREGSASAAEGIPAEDSGLGLKHLCLRVENLEAAIAEIEASGCSAFLPGKRLYEVCGSRLSKLVTPEGTVIELRE